MNWIIIIWGAWITLAMASASEADNRVEDAYAFASEKERQWVIGTSLIEAIIQESEQGLVLSSLSNKTLTSAPEQAPAEGTRIFTFGGDGWIFKHSGSEVIGAGGRPAVRLGLWLSNTNCDLRIHLTAFPHTPILRLDAYLTNRSADTMAMPAAKPLRLRVNTGGAPSSLFWMTNPGSVSLMQEAIRAGYDKRLNGTATAPLLPWMALVSEARGGVFASYEYIGRWALRASSADGKEVEMLAESPDLEGGTLRPGEKVSLPSWVFGVFENSLEDMSRHIYNWQYEYEWDLTHYDHYARTRWATEWFMSGLCLQDQFTGRLAASGMDAVDRARDMGYDILWDDAGWTTTEPTPGTPKPDFWRPKDGPDFSGLNRLAQKQGMGWALWIAGNTDLGQLSNYVGSWGPFEWRTDSVSFPSFAAERGWKKMVEQWLRMHPRSVYHTCNFGGGYSHTFDIQRLSTINYIADYGRSDEVNYYSSMLDTPDKWLDIVTIWGGLGVFHPDTARNTLTSSAVWTFATHEYEAAWRRHNDLYRTLVQPISKDSEKWASQNVWPDAIHSYDREAVRRNAEIYHYLVSQGVAGRWSYVERPRVDGDDPIFYFQRLSHDRKRSCIILKHRTDRAITIYPKGLLQDYRYSVGLETSSQIHWRNGADLMSRGIHLQRQKPAEVIYLGLPNIPGNQSDHIEPIQPGRVFKRYETNLGYSGIGLYWSAGIDNNWISYYEVARNGKVIGRAATGTFYFDRSIGWSAEAPYAVRTIDGDGNASGWTEATALQGEAPQYASLGGQFDEPGREGWHAEMTADLIKNEPMIIVPHLGLRALEWGGNCLQPGGLSGVWASAKPDEAGGKPVARVSRGWQSSTPRLASVRKWTAPMPGKIRVVGRAFRDYYTRAKAGMMRVRIMLNSDCIWPESGWAEIKGGDIVGVSHRLELGVKQGDIMRFVLDKTNADDSGVLAWMPTIQYADAKSVFGGSVVRILCGSEKDYKDSGGNVWSADTRFSGGRAVKSGARVMDAFPAQADAELYAYGRQGPDFTYRLPVGDGLYTLRLKFAETEKKWSFERPFDLYINGKMELLNYDIAQAARGVNQAFERIFRHVVPDADGFITLRFTGGWEPVQSSSEALIKAIEVLPQIKPVTRVNCGGGDFIDWNSNVWFADSVNGPNLTSNHEVILATPTIYDSPLYQNAKTGPELIYALDLPPGLYCIRMKFAELWLEKAGERPMDIVVNGRLFYHNFDPFTASGGAGRSIDLRAEDVTPDASGKITVRIRATGAHPAILQALEID